MWEDEVTRLLAATAAAMGVQGLTGYEPPADRLTGELEAAAPQDTEAERRLRRLAVIATDGEVV